MYCQHCGHRLTGRPRAWLKPYPDGEVRRQYWCQPRAVRGGCGRITIDQRELDRHVGALVVRILADPCHAKAVEAAAKATEDKRPQRIRGVRCSSSCVSASTLPTSCPGGSVGGKSPSSVMTSPLRRWTSASPSFAPSWLSWTACRQQSVAHGAAGSRVPAGQAQDHGAVTAGDRLYDAVGSARSSRVPAPPSAHGAGRRSPAHPGWTIRFSSDYPFPCGSYPAQSVAHSRLCRALRRERMYSCDLSRRGAAVASEVACKLETDWPSGAARLNRQPSGGHFCNRFCNRLKSASHKRPCQPPRKWLHGMGIYGCLRLLSEKII
ncbi:MAG: hypothetical protein JO281_03585 [Pseudonocardiales bacterium]|nr:hypothetical protein [Pseudonocardiales bacterium]